MPRELQLPIPPNGEDAAPYLDAADDQCVRDFIPAIVLDVGYYHFKSAPKPVASNVIGAGQNRTFLYKDFVSETASQGVLNACAHSFIWKDLAIVSSRASAGTGSLVSIVAPEGQTIGYWQIDHLYLTSDANWAKDEAFHEHGLYCDGTWGGRATAPTIRTGTIKGTPIFGTKRGGYSLLLRGCSGIRFEGGGITWAGGQTAVTRIDGLASGNCQSQNNTFAPNACMTIELENAHHLFLWSPVVEGDVVRGANVEHIRGFGDVKGERKGDWTSPKTTCKWN